MKYERGQLFNAHGQVYRIVGMEETGMFYILREFNCEEGGFAVTEKELDDGYKPLEIPSAC